MFCLMQAQEESVVIPFHLKIYLPKLGVLHFTHHGFLDVFFFSIIIGTSWLR